MNFEDEDYRRLYVRRTVTSKRLGWEGRAVRNEMLTEFDRAGVWEFTEDAARDIADLVDLPIEVVQVGLARLLATKTWVTTESQIVWPNFVPGQTCPRSDRIRQQELRERRRDEALSKAKPAKLTSDVTERHAPSRESRNVTPILTEPSSTEQSESLDARALDVPGLETVAHPGPLSPSRRDQELESRAYALSARGQPRHRFRPEFIKGGPTKANQAEGHMLGLTDEEIWARFDLNKNKYFPSPFDDDEAQFSRELAFAKADKEKHQFKSRAERDAFEMPGRERRA